MTDLSASVYIPIPHYPPFKLRSSLIDKDPVIWVHLLEGYIHLCKVLLAGDVTLSVKSQQQLQLLLKVYLAETAVETTKVFSLGAINADILTNTASLRAFMFQVICDYGALKTGLNGESLWNLVLVYGKNNGTLVRGIISGSHKSKFNDNKKSGKISSIPVLRRHILSLINESKFSKEDLHMLAILLGQQVSVSTTSSEGPSSNDGEDEPSKLKVLAKEKYSKSFFGANKFAELFVNEEWIGDLEQAYADGKSVNAIVIKNVAIISVLSLSVAKLSKLITSIGINSADNLIVAPLLGTIVLSDKFNALLPGLHDYLPFLSDIKSKEVVNVDEHHIHFLLEMFPNLTSRRAKRLLETHKNAVGEVTNALLEGLEKISDDEATDVYDPIEDDISQSELERGMSRFGLASNETNETIEKQTVAAFDSNLKKNTLTSALRLLYDSEEDERDDTYDDQEHNKGQAFAEFDQKVKPKEKSRVTVFDEDNSSSTSYMTQKTDQDAIELTLFGYLKTNGDSAFEKSARKSRLRHDMKINTGWSDEQIEGWSRMLKRSSKRFRLLEEEYVFSNSNRKRDKKNSEDETRDDENLIPSHQQNTASMTSRNSKKEHQKKGIEKAKHGNHNRKVGRNKKAKANLLGLD